VARSGVESLRNPVMTSSISRILEAPLHVMISLTVVLKPSSQPQSTSSKVQRLDKWLTGCFIKPNMTSSRSSMPRCCVEAESKDVRRHQALIDVVVGLERVGPCLNEIDSQVMLIFQFCSIRCSRKSSSKKSVEAKDLSWYQRGSEKCCEA